MAADKVARGDRDRRRGLHGGRQLLPDADWRRCWRGSAPTCAASTSPRSWRPPTRSAAPDDPRRPRRRGPGLPGGCRRGAREPAAAPQRPSRHRRHPRQARGGRRRDRRLAGAARVGPPDQGARAPPPRRIPASSSRQRCTRAGGHVHWARDADEANRIDRRDHPQSHGETEVIKVKTMTSDETRLNAALEAAGHHAVRDRPRGSHHPARRRPAVAHRRSGAAPEPRRDPRDVPADDGARRAGTRARGPGSRGAAVPAREVPAREGRASAAQTSRSPRPASICVVESEGNGRMCVTLPRVLVTLVGIEKVDPVVRRPGGVPPAAAALGDRRADEPVQLDLDRHTAGGRPRRVPRRAAGQRPDAACSRIRSRARRCTASAARRA